jgi:hypothetical protein
VLLNQQANRFLTVFQDITAPIPAVIPFDRYSEKRSGIIKERKHHAVLSMTVRFINDILLVNGCTLAKKRDRVAVS